MDRPPIADNEYVKKLLAVMEANNMPGAKDLLAMLGQVGAMENHLAIMVKELADMRRELAEARLNDHPIKNALQNAAVTLQGQMLDLHEKLAEIKQNIIEGCKNALEAFREKGLSVLRNIAEFFHIRPGLEALRDGIDKSIKFGGAAISRIETVSGEYHEAGRHFANMGRALIGKEPLQEAKPTGKLAKAVQAPYRADRAGLNAVRRCVTAAIGAVERLEKAERKEPVMETINKINARIAQDKKDAPSAGRSRPIAYDGR